MPNRTINFNPVKFTGNVAKTFVSATTQVISSYMPFTSDIISGASDAIFEIKHYVADNRPDRNNRSESSLLRSFANRSRDAAKLLISDISSGDLSFETSRNAIGDYLSRYKKDEFDFGGVDFGNIDFDSDDSDDNNFADEESFTASDFAEGMYASTSATIGAIEVSSKNIALMNAKSNDILANKLISNNMINMTQTMHMMDVVNKNIVSVNNNLTNIVEYYNTTMNSFIENTTTHFTKVEQFMDLVSKKYKGEEAQERKKSRKIFDGNINFGNLFTKIIREADSEFFGGNTTLQSIIKTMTGVFVGDKMPKWMQDMEGYTDFGEMLKSANPARILVERFLPDLQQLKRVDAITKALVKDFRNKIIAEVDDDDASIKGRIAKIVKAVLKDEEDESNVKYYKKRDISWNTSDSTVLQNIIPDLLSETNTNLSTINNSIVNIVELMENNVDMYKMMYKSIDAMHHDQLNYFKDNTTNGSNYYSERLKIETKRGKSDLKNMDKRNRKYRDNKNFRAGDLEKSKLNNLTMFNDETGEVDKVADIVESDQRRKHSAWRTGALTVATAQKNILFKNGQITDEAGLAAEYGSIDAVKEYNTRVGLLTQACFDERDYTDAGTNIGVADIIDKYEHTINSDKLLDAMKNIALDAGFDLDVSDSNMVDFANAMAEAHNSRVTAIKDYHNRFDSSPRLKMAYKKHDAVTGTRRGYGHQYEADFNGASHTSDAYFDVLKNSYNDFVVDLSVRDIKEKIEAAKRQGMDDTNPYIVRYKQQMDRIVEGVKRDLRKEEEGQIHNFTYGNNKANTLFGSFLHTGMKRFEHGVSDFIRGDLGVKDGLINIVHELFGGGVSDFLEDARNYRESRRNGQRYQVDFDDETGKARIRPTVNLTDLNNTDLPFGYAVRMNENGEPVGDPYPIKDAKGRTWEEYQKEQENKGYVFDDSSLRYRDENDNAISDRWVPKYKTGAMYIDEDKLVQVHEGEMILDRALSGNVREGVKNMINAGGWGSLSEKQQSELKDAISASDERFKGHEQEVIDSISREIEKHKNEDKITNVDLSKESVCFIENEKSDTFMSFLLKRLSELSINLGIITRSTIGEHVESIANDSNNKMKNIKNRLTGDKDENSMYSGGILSDRLNTIKDALNHLRFAYIDGKGYTGFARDENGEIIKDENGNRVVKTYDKNTDETNAILVKLKKQAIENAEKFANDHGWDDKQKAAYVKSISEMIDGMPGALSGAAFGSFFGLAGTAIGAIGGFAFANKTTRQAVFGELVKDNDGHHHVVGGIFGRFENKLIMTAEEVKDNFVTAAKEVGHNLKLGIKSFLERVTGKKGEISENIKKIFDDLEKGKGIGGHLIHGIKDTVSKVANGVTDIASDAVIVSSKVIFKAVGLPFNLLSSIIGGKEYKKHKREEKFARSDAIDDELIGNLKRYGINTVNATKGIRDALFKERHINIAGKGPIAAIKRNFEYTSLDNEHREGKDKHLFGEGGKLDNFIDSVTGFFTGGHTFNGAIQSIIAAIASGAFLALGNPVAATAVMGFAGIDAVVKQIFGLGIAQAGLKAVRRLKTRVDRKFSKARGVAGALMHATKQRLGINDDGYYAKQLIRGDDAKYIDIMSDVGMSEEEQAEFHETTKGVKNYKEYKERIKYLKNKKKEKEANGEKLGIDESNELDKLNKAKHVFSRLESGLSDEEFNEFQRLKSMKRKDMTKEQKARFRELKDKQGEFDAKYGNSTSRFNTALTALDPRALAMSRWKNSVSSMNASEYFKEAGISDDTAKNEQNYLYKKASIAREKIYKKFGSNLTDADFLDPDKRKEMNEIFKTITGKDISNYSTQEAMNMVNYFDPNRKTESEKEQEEYHVTVKDMLGSLKDAVTTVIPEKINAIIEKIGLKEKNEVGTSAKTSADLGVGSSRTKYAKMHGFDISKLKRGDAKEKAWFDKAVNDGELDVETINAITQAVAGHDKVTEEDYNQYASGATNIPHDQIAKLHAGEAVLDAETASTFRKGGFGLASGLNDVFASIKSQLGELVGVFKGNKHGNGDEKKGFLDKMKESFTGVGQKISNSVFGSGLIPIDPKTLKPDIPKILARAAALLGGLAFGAPLIAKLVEKLKPILEPIFTGISSSIKTALGFSADQTWGDIIADKLPEVIDPIIKGAGKIIVDAFNISNKFWQKVGDAVFDATNRGKADNDINKDKTVPTYLEYAKERRGQLEIDSDAYIASEEVADNSKYKTDQSAVKRDFASQLDEQLLIFRLSSYRTALINAAIKYANTWNYYGIIYRSNAAKEFESYLTSAEKKFIHSHVDVDESKLMFNVAKYKEVDDEKDFIDVFTNTAGIKIIYESDKELFLVANLEKVSKGSINSARDKVDKRIGILNDLSGENILNFGTAYWKNSKLNASRKKDPVYYDTTYFDSTYTDEPAVGDGIGYGYAQNDPRWANMGYGKFKNGHTSTIGSGGCGPTALSNVYANLTGKNINPAQMARFAQSNGYNTQGGTSAGLFTSGARKLGLTSNAISKTGSSIGRSIRNGNNVLIAGKNGPYTKAGHIMSIRGVDRYGNAIVDDPLRRGARHIPMNSLTKGMTHAWSIGNGIGFGDTPLEWAGRITGANFNVADGGSFGYDENIDAGCFFNSIINGYIATAVNSGMKFSELQSLLSPEKIQKESGLIGSNGYVSDRDGLINYMNSKTGLNISVTDVMDTSNGSQTKRIVNSVSEGIPVVLHTTNATQGTALGKIINAFGRKDGRWLSEHAIMIPGTANGKIVIINPRSSTDQINTDYDINTLTDAINNNYLRHTISFTGGKSERQILFEELTKAAKTGDSFAGKTFVEQFGASPGKYKTYMEYINNRPIKQTSANDASKTNINNNLAGALADTSGTTASGSGNWLSDLISKLGTFASNLLSGLMSGDSSHLLDGVFDSNTSYTSTIGNYSGGVSGTTTGGSFIGTESEFNSLKNAAMYDSNAYDAFKAKYGCKPNDFASFDDYVKAHGISVTGTSIDGFATPTSMLSEYNALPSWAKTPPLRDITNINDYAKAISYTSMIAPLGEAGVKFPPKSRDELNKMYFRIYNDVNAPSFGRRGFHFNPNRTGGFPGDDILNILRNSDNATVKSDANKLHEYIFNNFSSFPKSPNYYQIDESKGYSKEFLNALIQAEDALNMQLHSQYFNMLRSVAPNLTDPRGYVLAGDLMGVAPYGVQEQLAGSTTFDDVYNRLKTHWGSSHGSRIDRTYGAILNGLNGIPSYDKYVGYGDAGYNMRDKMHMYTDDVYMGDADHPMNVTMDSTPVTSRLDKLVELVDTALNGKPEPVSNGSNAKSVSIGNGDRKPAIKSSDSMKGTTNIGQHDRLADIHNRLARRTRTSVNYNQL